eukprot:7014714-Lingulodinium_polyedra.AAC.1
MHEALGQSHSPKAGKTTQDNMQRMCPGAEPQPESGQNHTGHHMHKQAHTTSSCQTRLVRAKGDVVQGA